MEYGVSRYPLSSLFLIDRERKRFLASARNDDTGVQYSRIMHLAKRKAGNKKGNPISEISFLDSGLFARTHKLEFVVQLIISSYRGRHSFMCQ
jgi:hypothetical protein